MTIGKPAPPTDEELAEFNDWRQQWEKLDAIGTERGWLAAPDWEEPPIPLSPQDRYRTDLAEWESREAWLARTAKSRPE